MKKTFSAAFSPERLTEARQRSELSRAELAKRAGISRQSMRNLEIGVNVPSVDLACRLAEVLGISIQDLTVRKEKGKR